MGKFRPKVSGKGKRWKKGHSSSSNPETRKHRDVAKSRFFQVQENAGKGNLTSDALKKHNAFLGERMDATESVADDDDGTVSGSFKTFKTFASDWSLCSNQSFSKLLRGFRSDSALHKEMLAVLAAVTEVIKQKGGTESVTEYFGALMTTLEVSETEDSLAAVLSLLGMGIKSVPETVLQAKFPVASKCLVEVLAKMAESNHSVVLRSLIGCLSVLLRAQETAVWSSTSTVRVFESLLAFTLHSKPKVRRAAQHAVCAVLKGSSLMKGDSPPAHHPAASHVAEYCTRHMEGGGGMGGCTTILHVLGMLKEILGTFPKTHAKSTCESILKVMTLGNVLVTSCGMQALHGLFLSRPAPATLTAALNAQLLTALHDYQPAPNDTQPTLAWLAVMQEAAINLAVQSVSLCCSHLPRLFTAATQLWLSDKVEVTNGATRCLLAITQDCVAPACATPQLAAQHQTTLVVLLATASEGLQYQYHSAWDQVLHLMATFFEVTGATCSGMLGPILKTLAELRDSHQFSYARELENAVCKAVKAMGPEAVMQVIPLKISGNETTYEFSRSWLLPVLREGIQNTNLAFFISYFLPVATTCRQRRLACESRKDMIGSHSYDLLQLQIWSLLPSFCDRPKDLEASFKNVAKVLGSAIRECPDLRISVLSSLRRLISCSSEQPGGADTRELARFAKNFLPIMLNIYTTRPVGSDEEGQRLATLETIKLYLTITEPGLCHEVFDRAAAKLEDADCDAWVKESVLDLLRALMRYQDEPRLRTLFKMCEEGVANTKNHHVQKKAYRMLEEMCSCDSEVCREFINVNFDSIRIILLTSLSKSATSSKGPRLRCLFHVVGRLDMSQLDVVAQIVPEAVLCCKDLNEKCRTAAFTLLVHVCRSMLLREHKPRDDILRDYVGLLLAGLAGSPNLCSATLLALAKVTYEFREILPGELIVLLLDNVCILSTSASREIVTSCLSYVKVFITSFSSEQVAPAVPTIVKAMLSMTEDCKRHLRNKYRNILDRFVRRYGWKAIADLVPSTEVMLHRRLKNLRKANEKKKKTRDQDLDSDSEHENFVVKARQKTMDEILAELDDSDEEEPAQARRVKKKRGGAAGSAWIQEGEDDIMDFTAAGANKNIRATKPGAAVARPEKKEASAGMKTASDGRLIIVDRADSDDEPRRRNNIDSDSDEEKQAPSGGKRKRRNSGTSEAPTQASTKYQAGGSGIHRPLRKTKTKPKPKSKGPTGTTGAEYRSSKAKGDVKRKGRPDPYAYVPMSRKMLNKRKKNKPSGQFTSLVRKGGKAKGKKKKHQ